jgi:hypothetical protein
MISIILNKLSLRLCALISYIYNAGNPNSNTNLVRVNINTSNKLELMKMRT